MEGTRTGALGRATVTLLIAVLGAGAAVALSRLPAVDLEAVGLAPLAALLAAGLAAAGAFAAITGLGAALRTGAAGALLAAGAAATLAAGAVGLVTGIDSLDASLVLAAGLLLGAAIADRAAATVTGRTARLIVAAVLLALAEIGVLAELLPATGQLLETARPFVAAGVVLVAIAAALAALATRLDAANVAFLIGAVAMVVVPPEAASLVGLPLLAVSQLLAGGALLDGFTASHASDETHHLPPLAASLSDAVLHFDGRLRLQEWNAAADRLIGLEASARGTRLDDLLGVTVADLPPEDGGNVTLRAVAGLELRLHRFGDGITVVIPDPGASPDTDRLGRELRTTIEELLAARRTIELQRAEIERASSVDGLTGVASRSAIIERLSVEVAQARRYQHPVAVVQIDIDDFAELNGRLGIDGGDGILREVALRVRLRVRTADALGRAGSDGFLAILPHTDEAGAAIFANALRERLAQRPIAIADESVTVTVSIGVAVMRPGEDLDLDGLLARVQEALDSAKGAGGDRIALDRLHGLARLDDRRRTALPDPTGEDETAQDSGR